MRVKARFHIGLHEYTPRMLPSEIKPQGQPEYLQNAHPHSKMVSSQKSNGMYFSTLYVLPPSYDSSLPRPYLSFSHLMCTTVYQASIRTPHSSQHHIYFSPKFGTRHRAPGPNGSALKRTAASDMVRF